MQWSVEALDAAMAELEALPPGLKGRMLRLFDLVTAYGVTALHEPHARQIDGKLWELRAKAREGIARGLYVAVSGQRVVVLHIFEKKTQKTPQRAIDLARVRMKEIKP